MFGLTNCLFLTHPSFMSRKNIGIEKISNVDRHLLHIFLRRKRLVFICLCTPLIIRSTIEWALLNLTRRFPSPLPAGHGRPSGSPGSLLQVAIWSSKGGCYFGRYSNGDFISPLLDSGWQPPSPSGHRKKAEFAAVFIPLVSIHPVKRNTGL